MSFGYESTNCALLSRCRLDDIIQLNTPPRVLQRLAKAKSITIVAARRAGARRAQD
jgi:hypothetical protein